MATTALAFYGFPGRQYFLGKCEHDGAKYSVADSLFGGIDFQFGEETFIRVENGFFDACQAARYYRANLALVANATDFVLADIQMMRSDTQAERRSVVGSPVITDVGYLFRP